MNGYTSGKTHRDPAPYECTLIRGKRAAYRLERPPVTEGWEVRYDPRPEYDNHNPILEDLRENGDIAGHLEFCAEIHPAGHYSTPLGKAHITHARRVLTKLAALTKAVMR